MPTYTIPKFSKKTMNLLTCNDTYICAQNGMCHAGGYFGVGSVL